MSDTRFDGLRVYEYGIASQAVFDIRGKYLHRANTASQPEYEIRGDNIHKATAPRRQNSTSGETVSTMRIPRARPSMKSAEVPASTQVVTRHYDGPRATFSKRHGFRSEPKEITVREDAPSRCAILWCRQQSTWGLAPASCGGSCRVLRTTPTVQLQRIPEYLG